METQLRKRMESVAKKPRKRSAVTILPRKPKPKQKRKHERPYKSDRSVDPRLDTAQHHRGVDGPRADMVEQHKQYQRMPYTPSLSDRYQKRLYMRSLKNVPAHTLREQDCRCAEEAIQFYNMKHGTKYRIVETLGSYCHPYIGFWYHCNFRAECKYGTDRGHPKLFFAELKQGGELDVIDCKMLDGPGHRPDTVLGCKMCFGPLVHPVNGFQVGK